MNDTEKQKQLTLGVLQAIEQRDDISQRHLAQEMGIALGLANSYLKRCAKKGWIKITTAPANRYLYYLTPTGFAEKAKLTAEFLSTSLTLFREAGDAYTQLYDDCADKGHYKITLLGVSDLTEIAYLRSLESRIKVDGIIDVTASRHEFFGVPVTANFDQVSDAIVVTAMSDALGLIDQVKQHQPSTPVLIPEFLRGINAQANKSDSDAKMDTQHQERSSAA